MNHTSYIVQHTSYVIHFTSSIIRHSSYIKPNVAPARRGQVERKERWKRKRKGKTKKRESKSRTSMYSWVTRPNTHCVWSECGRCSITPDRFFDTHKEWWNTKTGGIKKKGWRKHWKSGCFWATISGGYSLEVGAGTPRLISSLCRRIYWQQNFLHQRLADQNERNVNTYNVHNCNIGMSYQPEASK